MKNYNERLDELFKEWEAKSKANGDDVISKDGLMCKQHADVNELWEQSPRKVMFLMKEQPNGWGDDTRNWLVLPDEDPNAKRNKAASPTFLKRLALLLYGFTYNVTDYWSIDEEDAVKCFNEVPFAFVEAKKQSKKKESDKPEISDAEMDMYIERYKDFLLEEIAILEPNIIVCCGGPQYHFALNTLYKKEELECIDKNVYYDKDRNVLVIYSPHPSARCSHADFYAGVMWHYGEFLKKHPDFLKE